MEDKTVILRPAAATHSRSISKISPAIFLVGLFLLSGCGGGSDSTSSSASTPSTPAATPTTSTTSSTPTTGASGGQKLSLAANAEGQLAYDTASLSAKAGAVTVDFTNSSPVGHDVAFASASGETVGSTPVFQGGSKTLTLNLKPGTYKFYCTVTGHRAAGMEGTLTVK